MSVESSPAPAPCQLEMGGGGAVLGAEKSLLMPTCPTGHDSHSPASSSAHPGPCKVFLPPGLAAEVAEQLKLCDADIGHGAAAPGNEKASFPGLRADVWEGLSLMQREEGPSGPRAYRDPCHPLPSPSLSHQG